MKKLSVDLTNISNTAEKTDLILAERKCSLTNDDLRTIIQGANALMVQEPDAQKILAMLKSQIGLSKEPEVKTNMISRGYGAEFIPSDVDFEEMTPQQKEKARQCVWALWRPMSDEGLIKLYTRLVLITKKAKGTSNIDETLRQAIYCEELKKYPANVVRAVMMRTYEFFPCLNELICECESECRILNILKRKLGINDTLAS